MKKRLAALLAVLMMLTVCLPVLGECTPLLYRATDGAGHEIYLMGTIHLARESTYPLPDYVLDAFERCDVLAVELDVQRIQQDPYAMGQMMLAMYLQNGQTSPLSQETLEKAAQATGMPAGTLASMRPWAVMNLLQEKAYAGSSMDAALGVDQYLLTLAGEKGKQVDELENLDDQMALLTGMPESVVVWQIEAMLSAPAGVILSTMALLDNWARGDRAGLNRLLTAEEDPAALAGCPDGAGYMAYMQAMYGDRDTAFARQAADYLDAGTRVFFAVGAAHVLGDGGVADQLAEMGYTVETVGAQGAE